MGPDVFLSIGTPATSRQEAFVAACEGFLQLNGLNPRALGRSEWSRGQPLAFIHEVMSECAGTIVLAYERVHIASGTYKRGHADAETLQDAIVPSVWNQVEAAMAYELGHPLLVLVEEGLREEGLLEDGHDWIVHRVPLEISAFESDAFLRTFETWKQQVVELAATGKAASPGDRPQR